MEQEIIMLSCCSIFLSAMFDLYMKVMDLLQGVMNNVLQLTVPLDSYSQYHSWHRFPVSSRTSAIPLAAVTHTSQRSFVKTKKGLRVHFTKDQGPQWSLWPFYLHYLHEACFACNENDAMLLVIAAGSHMNDCIFPHHSLLIRLFILKRRFFRPIRTQNSLCRGKTRWKERCLVHSIPTSI